MAEEQVSVVTDVVLNPLLWYDLEFNREIDDPHDSLLRFLCPVVEDHDIAALKKRYFELQSASSPLSVVPAEPTILQRIVAPLHQARVDYVIANFLGTIALCGSVSEMLAILVWTMSDINIGKSPTDSEKEKLLFGSVFERLGQERRVNALLSMNLINDAMKSDFDLVRSVRRPYLHLYSSETTEIKDHAKASYAAAVRLASAIIGHKLSEGRFEMNAKLMKFLQEQGIVRRASRQPAEEESERELPNGEELNDDNPQGKSETGSDDTSS